MHYYKVPLKDGMFVGIDYKDIVEGVAFAKHVLDGYGYVASTSVLPFETVTEEEFNAERM